VAEIEITLSKSCPSQAATGFRPWQIVLCLLGLSACQTTTIIDEHRNVPASIGANESVVVLGRHNPIGQQTDGDFVRCVGDRLGAGTGRLSVVPQGEFLDSVYPWFEASTAPTDVKNLDKLLAVDSVARRFSQYGIRYFIWIDGFTETTDRSGSMSCAIGPGGGGCFGFASWTDEADYEASIWDVKDSIISGKINTDSHGTSYVPAVIIPIPLLARVKANACASMAQQLKSFLAAEPL
jgi:hypothetical protein